MTGEDPAAPDYGLHRHRLTTLLATAKQHIPYYRQKWREAGIDVANLDPARDFQQLPIVHKTDLRQFAVEDRLDQRFKLERLQMQSTSGSSGEPFQESPLMWPVSGGASFGQFEASGTLAIDPGSDSCG